MPGPKQRWINPPQFGDSVTSDWATWLTNAINDLQGPTKGLSPPQVTTISHPGAVHVVWNEVNQATSYSAYETSSAISPPGVPFATVAANVGAQANGVMRFNLNDTTVRYYSVVAITQWGRSQPSVAVPGAALAVAATVIPVSQTPVNQNGVGGGVGGGGGLFGRGQGPNF